MIWACYYVEDQYTTQTILKPSRQFYKRLVGFKTGWPNLMHCSPQPTLKPTNAQSCSLLNRPGPALDAVATEPVPVPNVPFLKEPVMDPDA